eukprot:CAMPEP_0176386020 /NCGR_PEP_ID=MMETSP0126-20121128/35598_1 /TAXON_ID=141414 ORGANISM="Strombidinopsis acuminatum, Strain SPMC142" /NCGR_SAMPLE_ID=MMETSP0126 /ASSEMBLY_ACC=CAM_ASM_000229 /LENGTH=61 /DNA_ID=CAMNT_0017752695 /DNA_START=401 /DNA_END=586 /DNA_ORIENTATION=+
MNSDLEDINPRKNLKTETNSLNNAAKLPATMAKSSSVEPPWQKVLRLLLLQLLTTTPVAAV